MICCANRFPWACWVRLSAMARTLLLAELARPAPARSRVAPAVYGNGDPPNPWGTDSLPDSITALAVRWRWPFAREAVSASFESVACSGAEVAMIKIWSARDRTLYPWRHLCEAGEPLGFRLGSRRSVAAPECYRDRRRPCSAAKRSCSLRSRRLAANRFQPAQNR
jgi:hypothetical protein